MASTAPESRGGPGDATGSGTGSGSQAGRTLGPACSGSDRPPCGGLAVAAGPPRDGTGRAAAVVALTSAARLVQTRSPSAPTRAAADPPHHAEATVPDARAAGRAVPAPGRAGDSRDAATIVAWLTVLTALGTGALRIAYDGVYVRLGTSLDSVGMSTPQDAHTRRHRDPQGAGWDGPWVAGDGLVQEAVETGAGPRRGGHPAYLRDDLFAGPGADRDDLGERRAAE